MTTTDPAVRPVRELVTFRLGPRDYATPLAEVREVVRLQGLADLPGMQPPLAGVLDLRGVALPVLDLRRPGGDAGRRGDVLVVEADPATSPPPVAGGTGQVGVAVDAVRAVVPAEDLPPAGGADRAVLPDYVLDVLRGDAGVVFLVDLHRMVAAARRSALPAVAG